MFVFRSLCLCLKECFVGKCMFLVGKCVWLCWKVCVFVGKCVFLFNCVCFYG